MKEWNNKLGYYVTDDLNLNNERYGITPELAEQMDELFHQSQDKTNNKIIPRLNRLISQYPKCPVLLNHLGTAYMIQGARKKATDINEQLLQQFPDYLYGKLRKAIVHLINNEPDEALKILGEQFDLRALYPGKEMFQVSEIMAYYKVVIHYLIDINNAEGANKFLELMEEVAPDHFETDDARELIENYELRKGMEIVKKSWENRIKVECSTPMPVSRQKFSPAFINESIYSLYEIEEEEMTDERIHSLLSLSRQSLIEDLEKVIQDGMDRYHYFSESPELEYAPDAIFHAINLLAELRAVNSLPVILNFLENHEYLVEFWLNYKIAYLWQAVFILGENNLDLLKDFLIKPGVCAFSKNPVSKALSQIALHYPDKETEILNLFDQVLESYDKAEISDNLIDSEYLGKLMNDLVDCRMDELLPRIKSLYEKKYVNELFAGSFTNLENSISEEYDESLKEEVHSIYNLYSEINSTDDFDDESDDMDDDLFDDEAFDDDHADDFLHDLNSTERRTAFLSQSTTQSNIPKPGRNDLCYCGSGKKYKKCCINKDIAVDN